MKDRTKRLIQLGMAVVFGASVAVSIAVDARPWSSQQRARRRRGPPNALATGSYDGSPAAPAAGPLR